MALAHSPRIVTDGLVCYLDAANTKSYPGSGTTWKDLSGNENDDSVNSSASLLAENGGVFNYSSTIVTLIPDSYGLSLQNETIMCIAKCDFLRSNAGGGSFSNRIIQWGSYYNNNSGGFGLQSGSCRMYLKGSTNSGWSDSSSSSAANQIYDQYDFVQYVVRFIGNDRVLVTLNGIDCFDRTISDGYTGYTSNRLDFGVNMDMTLSNIQLYNKVLNDTEIKQNFNALRGRYGI